MKHIKRGYGWFLAKLGAFFGLVIGSQVITINTTNANIYCNYNSSNVETYTSADGKMFSYCSGRNGWDWCSGNANISISNYCTPSGIMRYYFFFLGCPSGYYSNYKYGAQITPDLRHCTTGYGCGLNTSTCNSSCYNIGSTGAEWRTLTSAKATAESMVTCTSCPPYGTVDAQSDGKGAISTCYMSSATSYADPDGSGTHIWTSACYYTE